MSALSSFQAFNKAVPPTRLYQNRGCIIDGALLSIMPSMSRILPTRPIRPQL